MARRRIPQFDMKPRERRIYRQGLLDALALVEEWDKYVLHHVRLSDALRLKLNLIRKRDVRKHPIIA